jgi:hypothetical protein
MKYSTLLLLLLGCAPDEPLVDSPPRIFVDTNDQSGYVVGTAMDAAPPEFGFAEHGSVQLAEAEYPVLCAFEPGDNLIVIRVVDDPEFYEVVSENLSDYFNSILELLEE